MLFLINIPSYLHVILIIFQLIKLFLTPFIPPTEKQFWLQIWVNSDKCSGDFFVLVLEVFGTMVGIFRNSVLKFCNCSAAVLEAIWQSQTVLVAFCGWSGGGGAGNLEHFWWVSSFTISGGTVLYFSLETCSNGSRCFCSSLLSDLEI